MNRSDALPNDRSLWLAADWGMGADGFLWSVKSSRNQVDHPTFRLDFSEFKDRQQFLDVVYRTLDCSFERLCELLSNVGPAFLLLDEIPTGTKLLDGEVPVETELENLAKVILEYCPELAIILRTLRAPTYNAFHSVELKPLDEADLRTYLVEHERGGLHLNSPESVTQIHRYTDGIPSRVDTCLKDLEVITLSELLHTNSDLATYDVVAADAPPALTRAIQELANDPEQGRSFELLKVLTLFPQGEQLRRIERFHGPHGFHPTHAQNLHERALITAPTTEGIGPSGVNAPVKTLLVPKPIREWVREKIDRNELVSLDHKAANLYFGPKWSMGIFKPPPSYGFNKARGNGADIANASAVLLRLLNDATRSGDARVISSLLRTATSFVEALTKGHHYRSIAAFCEDVLSIIPEDGFEALAASLKHSWGQGLRMLGETERAKEILLEIAEFPFPKTRMQKVLLSLALCHESADETDEAKRVANQVIKLDRHTAAALQAQAIILEAEPPSVSRSAKLAKLEASARKRKFFTAANNIALTRANEIKGDSEEVRRILMAVLKVPDETSGFYNQTRALLGLTSLAFEQGETLSRMEEAKLIAAYHFLFSERIYKLFDKCHRILWKNFELKDDTVSLLNMFRHSSFLWRLRGKDELEQRYLRNLAKIVGSGISGDVRTVSREAAYYLVRAHSALLLANAKN